VGFQAASYVAQGETWRAVARRGRAAPGFRGVSGKRFPNRSALGVGKRPYAIML
jgi:hypothetical protein